MLTELRIAGYRSLREITLQPKRLNVITGANGAGKSNLYRAVYLAHTASRGTLARTIAEEGGMPSVLWAGARKRSETRRLSLGVTLESGLSYELSCGLPDANELPTGSFLLDPVIKEESITFREGRRVVTLLERGKSGCSLRTAEGTRENFTMTLTRNESVLTQITDPHRYPHISALREEMSRWRFYHQFRTDESAPVRQPQVGVFTPVLSHEGRDLAAALQTIVEIGDADALYRSVRQAFAGAHIMVASEEGRFRVLFHTPGLLRPLETWELSDGTLRYLCLLAALLSPRPPQVLALNEPETSLHPDLMEPLARLVVDASRTTQIWLTTHAKSLVEHVERLSGVTPVVVRRTAEGETRV